MSIVQNLGAWGAAQGEWLYRSRHTVTADEDTAGLVHISTGLADVSVRFVQVIRSGKVATSDAAVSDSGGVVTVADGSTYVLTAADVIDVIAIGPNN